MCVNKTTTFFRILLFFLISPYSKSTTVIYKKELVELKVRIGKTIYMELETY